MIIAPVMDNFYRPFLKFYFSSVFVMVFCDNCLSLTAKESDNLLQLYHTRDYMGLRRGLVVLLLLMYKLRHITYIAVD